MPVYCLIDRLSFLCNVLILALDESASQMELPFGDDATDVHLHVLVRRMDRELASILSLRLGRIVDHYDVFHHVDGLKLGPNTENKPAEVEAQPGHTDSGARAVGQSTTRIRVALRSRDFVNSLRAEKQWCRASQLPDPCWRRSSIASDSGATGSFDLQAGSKVREKNGSGPSLPNNANASKQTEVAPTTAIASDNSVRPETSLRTSRTSYRKSARCSMHVYAATNQKEGVRRIHRMRRIEALKELQRAAKEGLPNREPGTAHFVSRMTSVASRILSSAASMSGNESYKKRRGSRCDTAILEHAMLRARTHSSGTLTVDCFNNSPVYSHCNAG